jgi:hypothetical protein
MKRNTKILILLLVFAIVSLGCKYIVVPKDLIAEKVESELWGAVITNVTQTDAGDLHIDITIQNKTGEWSSMRAVDGEPAILKSGGNTQECDVVFVGTGGYRLAPGFQMRGYTTGTKFEPLTQLIYVECKGVAAEPGATLTIDYIYFNGDLDYYHQEDIKSEGTLELTLDAIATDLKYPVYEAIDGLAISTDAEIPAISENVVKLLDIQRTEEGFEFTWENFNPTEFALKTHIGTPPVIGEAGILYGVFQIMDLASVPLTPANGKVEWTTKMQVPAEEKGFYILLSVESKQMRMYVNHLIDITDK